VQFVFEHAVTAHNVHCSRTPHQAAKAHHKRAWLDTCCPSSIRAGATPQQREQRLAGGGREAHRINAAGERPKPTAVTLPSMPNWLFNARNQLSSRRRFRSGTMDFVTLRLSTKKDRDFLTKPKKLGGGDPRSYLSLVPYGPYGGVNQFFSASPKGPSSNRASKCTLKLHPVK